MTRRMDRRELILDAACDVIGRHGLGKTTMEDIARGAGIRAASIYHYFDSKEAVFAAVMEREGERFLSRVEEAVERAGSASDKLLAFVTTRYQHLNELRALYELDEAVVLELLPLAHQARKEFLSRERQLLEGILEEGVKRGEFEIEDVGFLALVIIAAIQGVDSTFLLYREEFPAEGLPKILEYLLYGIVRSSGRAGDGEEAQ